MPNTSPPVDTPEAVRALKEKAQGLGLARLHPAAALTLAQEGKALTEAGLLKEAGAFLLTDDGHTNEDAGILGAGLLQASSFGLPVAVHAEDASLRRGGVMNDGPWRTSWAFPETPPRQRPPASPGTSRSSAMPCAVAPPLPTSTSSTFPPSGGWNS